MAGGGGAARQGTDRPVPPRAIPIPSSAADRASGRRRGPGPGSPSRSPEAERGGEREALLPPGEAGAGRAGGRFSVWAWVRSPVCGSAVRRGGRPPRAPLCPEGKDARRGRWRASAGPQGEQGATGGQIRVWAPSV